MKTGLVGVVFVLFSAVTLAQRGGGATNPIASLKGVAVPQPANLDRLRVRGREGGLTSLAFGGEATLPHAAVRHGELCR